MCHALGSVALKQMLQGRSFSSGLFVLSLFSFEPLDHLIEEVRVPCDTRRGRCAGAQHDHGSIMVHAMRPLVFHP